MREQKDDILRDALASLDLPSWSSLYLWTFCIWELLKNLFVLSPLVLEFLILAKLSVWKSIYTFHKIVFMKCDSIKKKHLAQCLARNKRSFIFSFNESIEIQKYFCPLILIFPQEPDLIFFVVVSLLNKRKKSWVFGSIWL